MRKEKNTSRDIKVYAEVDKEKFNIKIGEI